MLPILTITIPVLNEEKTLVEKINILQDYIDNNLSKIVLTSIVIADNGSEDDTLKIAKKLSEKNRNIFFLTTTVHPAPLVGRMEPVLAGNRKT